MPAAAACLAWSPDDRLLAIGSEKGFVYVLRCAAMNRLEFLGLPGPLWQSLGLTFELAAVTTVDPRVRRAFPWPTG